MFNINKLKERILCTCSKEERIVNCCLHLMRCENIDKEIALKSLSLSLNKDQREKILYKIEIKLRN